MAKCLFERATFLFIGGTSFDDIPHNINTHVQITCESFPDRRTERWDGANGVRPATLAEVQEYDDMQLTAEAAGTADQKIIKAVLTYLIQRLNELRTQPTTTFPALTAQAVRDGIVAIYKSL